jgi:transposase
MGGSAKYPIPFPRLPVMVTMRVANPHIREPQRLQSVITFEVPEDALPTTHPARVLWTVLGGFDLSAFSAEVTSVAGDAGRPQLSPRMMLTLWFFAISEGVGSARKIARLIRRDTAYRWIVGDLTVSHDKLSKFRREHGAAFDTLFTDVVATLLHKGLLSLDLVTQDGTRTRAAASAPSFRSFGSLLHCREQAALHLKAVLADDHHEHTKAERARREAAARDYQARVEAAIDTVKALQAERGPKAATARASTTDADARVMKMGDGGFRPALNVQYAVAGSGEGGPRAIVGVRVTNVGSDMGSLTPMIEQIEARTGETPKTLLADGGYAKHDDIVRATQHEVTVLVPPSDRAKSIETLRQEGAPPEVIAWRERMETPEAKEQYRARASLCELANAHQKTHHGIQQLLVRGIPKATCVILMGAITMNLLQFAARLA